jgi:hypothetical protein
MSSLSVSAFGQPRLTKPTLGALAALAVAMVSMVLMWGSLGAGRASLRRCGDGQRVECLQYQYELASVFTPTAACRYSNHEK